MAEHLKPMRDSDINICCLKTHADTLLSCLGLVDMNQQMEQMMTQQECLFCNNTAPLLFAKGSYLSQ